MARAHSADGTVAAAGTPPQETAERHGGHHSAPGPGAAPAGPVPPTSSGSRTALDAALNTTIEPRLLERALTHRSYSYEHGALPHNERLEFLGDSVLGLVVTDALYRDHPDLPEGQLAKLRASVVNMRALAGVARELGPGGLGAHLLLGHGEETTGGRDKASILADATEAVLGAVYIDRGLAVAAEVILRLFGPLMREAANRGAGLDWKTSLQELASALAIGSPDYLVTESGPDHRKSFAAVANVGDESFGTGTGTSKKEAEQKAAEMAWTAMQERAAAAHHQQQRSD